MNANDFIFFTLAFYSPSLPHLIHLYINVYIYVNYIQYTHNTQHAVYT
jgi:hypothetical protein